MIRESSLVLATVLALATTVRAQRPPQELLRLTGHVGPPTAGRTPAATLDLDVDGTRLRFQAEEARVLRGGRLGANVLDELVLERPLYTRGPKEMLETIRHAPPEKRLEISVFYRSGSRTLLVHDVKDGDVSPGGERSSASPR